MNIKPKVSVIIPVYNIKDYLGICLDSLINQTLHDIEIICINDGSTDSSLDVLNAYAAKDSRIVIVNKENEGQGIARNLGIGIANGEYIGFLDPDDWVDIDMYESMYNQAKKLDSDIVVCDYTKYKEQENEFLKCDFWFTATENYKFKRLEIPVGENLDKDYIYKSLLIAPCYAWNKIYKSELLKSNNIVFSTARCFEDCIFAIDAMCSAQNVSYINSDFYKYRIHANSTLRSFDRISNALFEVFKVLKNSVCAHNLTEMLGHNLKFFIIMHSFWIFNKLAKSEQKRFIKQLKNEISSDCYKKVKKLIAIDYANKIFSITNSPRRKILNIAGFQIKFKYLKGQYKLEQDYINKITREQKKYHQDTYLLFDCLQDASVEAIDAYSLFLYLKNHGKKVYYVLLKSNKLYKKLESENNLDGVIGLDAPPKDYPGDFLKTLYEVLLRTKYIVTSFYETSDVIGKFFKKNPCWRYVFIQHGPTYLKESVMINGYISPEKFDKILISSEHEYELFKKYNWPDEKLIRVGLPRWDLLPKENVNEEKSILVMFTLRRFDQLSFENSLYKKNLLNLLNNKELNEYLKERNIKLYFASHHSFFGVCGVNLKFELENIQCVDSSQISQYIRKCNALITDLSSVAFDFMFQNKPVICYILDKEDETLSKLDRFDVNCFEYKQQMMPNVFFDEKAVIQKIKYYIDNNFELEPDTKEQYNKFFNTKDDIIVKLINEIEKVCK